MVEREAREPGWYWVKTVWRRKKWQAAQWIDDRWFCVFSDQAYVDDDMAEIGPRLTPPSQPPAPQPQDGRTVMTNTDFARLISYIAKHAAQWTGEMLDAGEADEVVRLGSVMRFIDDMTRRLRWIESRAGLPPAPATIAGEVVSDGE